MLKQQYKVTWVKLPSPSTPDDLVEIIERHIKWVADEGWIFVSTWDNYGYLFLFFTRQVQ